VRDHLHDLLIARAMKARYELARLRVIYGDVPAELEQATARIEAAVHAVEVYNRHRLREEQKQLERRKKLRQSEKRKRKRRKQYDAEGY